MDKNPLVYAAGAAVYIAVVVYTMDALMSSIVPEETLLIPITILSLFVLSAAVMGFLFLYEPLNLYVEGKRVEAARFFLKTVGTFAVFVAVLVCALFYTLH